MAFGTFKYKQAILRSPWLKGLKTILRWRGPGQDEDEDGAGAGDGVLRYPILTIGLTLEA